MATVLTTDSSDAPVPSSSPNLAEEPLSTPPSSPPEFPWEQLHRERDDKSDRTKAEKPCAFNVLSVLGKRKAILQSTSHNVRPVKRVQATARGRASNMTQMQLALGQKVEKKCEECGMVYVLSSSEDRKLHERFHISTQQGCEMGNEFVRKTPESQLTRIGREKITTAKDDVICVVTRSDQKWRRKYAREVLNIITNSLGACTITDEELWAENLQRNTSEHTVTEPDAFEMYLYIRGGRCVSAAVVEPLRRKARRVVRPPNNTKVKSVGTGLSTLEQLHARRQAEETHDEQNLTLSDAVYDVRIGVCRIWTAPASRGQDLASAILDEIYHRRVVSQGLETVSKESAVAFSQPTSAGTRLARRWFGQKYGWYAYG